MKYTIGIILSILVGSFIGIFGVLVSVFSDGGLTERLITIGVILLIYCIMGAALGLFLPDFSWKWGLIAGIPGVLILGVYMLREYNPYYLIYMALIVYLACFSAWGGSVARTRRER